MIGFPSSENATSILMPLLPILGCCNIFPHFWCRHRKLNQNFWVGNKILTFHFDRIYILIIQLCHQFFFNRYSDCSEIKCNAKKDFFSVTDQITISGCWWTNLVSERHDSILNLLYTGQTVCDGFDLIDKMIAV